MLDDRLPAPIRDDIARLPPSGIHRVFMAGYGRPGLIPLWVGEGDQPTPAFIGEAATAALKAGKTFYNPKRGIPELRQALAAYLWAWAENQVMAAVKAVPLGQSAGQRLLAGLGERIPALVEFALRLPEARWSNYTPGLAIASSRHETQYTRLFRS